MARKTKAIFSPEDKLVLLGAYEDGMDGVGKEKLDRTSVQLGKSSEEVRVSVIRKHGLKCTTLLVLHCVGGSKAPPRLYMP